MNAGPPGLRRITLASRARLMTERASAVLAGIWPHANLSAADPPAGPALSPRQLTRGLARRTRAAALARLNRLPCFQAADYAALNPDVEAAGFDAAFHALFIGAIEGRQLFRRDRLARALGGLNGFAVCQTAPPQQPVPVGIYVSSLGNVFMQDIARDLADCLAAAGVPVTLRDEAAPAARRPPFNIFVAPHEFFALGRGPAWVRDDVVSTAVMLNTEQAQTPWFATALPFLLAARGVIDLSAQHTALFANAGIPAHHATPVPARSLPRLNSAVRAHPLYRALPDAALLAADPAAPLTARPLDIAFFGGHTPDREAWHARNTAFLASYNTFFYDRRQGDGPLRAGTPDGALSALASHVCGHSKLLLNLHRDEFGYFEWHRIVRLGMASGCVVVSEPCPPHPVLLPGVHFFAAAARQIPDLIEWLLRSEDGRQRAQEVQEAAADALAYALDPACTGHALMAFLLQAASR